MIPEGYGSPEMTPVSTTLGEIYQFEVSRSESFADGSALDSRLADRAKAQRRARRGRGQQFRRRAQDL